MSAWSNGPPGGGRGRGGGGNAWGAGPPGAGRGRGGAAKANGVPPEGGGGRGGAVNGNVGPPGGGRGRGDGSPAGGRGRGGRGRGGHATGNAEPPRGGRGQGETANGNAGQPSNRATEVSLSIRTATKPEDHATVNLPIRTATNSDNLPLPDIMRVPASTPFPPYTQPNTTTISHRDAQIKPSQKLKKMNLEFPTRQTWTPPDNDVITNHFSFQLEPKVTLYEYKILGLPLLRKAKTKTLFESIIENTPILHENQERFATDYFSTIVSWEKMDSWQATKDNSFTFSTDGLTIRYCQGNLTLSIQINYHRIVDIDTLKGYSSAGDVSNEKVTETIGPTVNALNILVSKTISRPKAIQVEGNRFFCRSGYVQLKDSSLCTGRGYFYTVKPGMGKVLLNFNVCTSAFFRSIPVSDVMLDQRTFPRASLKSALKGLQVYLTYGKGHIITIETIGDPVETQKFTQDDKTIITVQEYFRRHYPLLALRYTDLSAVGTKNGSWYPPELLQVVPFQMYKQVLPSHLAADMITAACRPPKENRSAIQSECLDCLDAVEHKTKITFPACSPFYLDSRMLQIPAGSILQHRVLYGNGKYEQISGGSSWNLSNLGPGKNCFLETKPKSFRLVLFIDANLRDTGPTGVVDRYTKELYTRVKTLGIGTFKEVYRSLVSGEKDMDDAMQNAKKNLEANFALLILSGKNVSLYAAFKNLADRKHDMHSLCFTEKPKMDKNRMVQYFDNIMMKCNLKAQGLNHSHDSIPKYMKDTLVLGADVTHPSVSSSLGTPSIAAVVGSVEKYGGKFLGSMRLQKKDKDEMIRDVLESMVTERLNDWYEANQKVPKNILYYRDGVSDSQYRQVQQVELPQIRAAFSKFARRKKSPLKPKLTALVVSKRHHVRFYPLEKDEDLMGNRNCKPGTIVDTVVTSPYYNDFYLQSHSGLKGCARPTHYFLLENGMEFPMDELKTFTHKLCFTYVRSTRSASYAPPAYYADRLCERARCYLRELYTPDPDMRNQLRKERDKEQENAEKKRDEVFKDKREKFTKGVGNKAKEVEKKTQEEIKQVKEDQTRIEDEFNQKGLNMGKKVLYAFNGKADDGEWGNPWKKGGNIAKTMFWM